MAHTWSHPSSEFEVSTDPSRIDLAAVHGYLSASYWAKGIPPETVRRSIQNSLCFGVYRANQQIGFARVITDRATYAYLADVFVLEAYRGRGLSKWLMECVFAHPELQGLRRWSLATRNAHGLYRKFGFQDLKSSGTMDGKAQSGCLPELSPKPGTFRFGQLLRANCQLLLLL
jgi:GNAT superfamily N-acetyltransferase